MDSTTHLKEQILQLDTLLLKLAACSDYQGKCAILNANSHVQTYISQPGPVQKFLSTLFPESDFVMKSIIAIEQAPIVFNTCNADEEITNKLLDLLERLLEIEVFYRHIGGILGYHLTVLKLIVNSLEPSPPFFEDKHYIKPEGLYLNEDDSEVRRAVRHGIENLSNIAMIYPIGGAGDRLNFKDEKTEDPLPVAQLPFLGRTLLEGMIRDLQAKEFLSFKLTGKRVITPIAIMTSIEKKNNIHVFNICKSQHWFGRSAESFYLFIQPLVPVITIEGNWSLSAPLTLNLKPCGHGALWKLAEEEGVFKWLASQGRNQSIVRQINNPLAGTDYALLALIGEGCHRRKSLGFLSCDRVLNSDEGTNVLIETKTPRGFDYCLTNIEYPEFAQKGIKEIPNEPGSCFSIYPANTNLLFIDISSIRNALRICPIPGQIINMKTKVPYIDSKGEMTEMQGGRLESTMQNIADAIIDSFPKQLTKNQRATALSSFILYNPRSKTISVTKRTYLPSKPTSGTPEHAYYDLLTTHYDLLRRCGFKLNLWKSFEKYLLEGPSHIFIYHPALGPLYSIIAQKIRKGTFAEGSELQLEISELDIENLILSGSLLIDSTFPLGSTNTSGVIEYGNSPKCTLKNVIIKNQGIDRTATHCYWKNEIIRHEEVKITLNEGSEFLAENVLIEGAHHFEVPAYHRLIIQTGPSEQWHKVLTQIERPTWYWQYTFDDDDIIKLKKEENDHESNK